MNNHSESGTKPENLTCQQWGLKRTITPCFGARLVQEGNRVHFLADRAGFNGAFSDNDALRLDQAFPLMLKQLEFDAHQRRTLSLASALRHAISQWTDLRSRHTRLLWLCLHRYLSRPA
ncbi:Antitoxin YeeU [Citrobacter koseri]|uniref:Antitoxin YeeU n=1 Tax=Citrobacter koseri TaxID=545 RepID=A0A2X2WFC2_CITKO|nr:Antitoxin YeeU [Citrobacter koseri]